MSDTPEEVPAQYEKGAVERDKTALDFVREAADSNLQLAAFVFWLTALAAAALMVYGGFQVMEAASDRSAAYGGIKHNASAVTDAVVLLAIGFSSFGVSVFLLGVARWLRSRPHTHPTAS